MLWSRVGEEAQTYLSRPADVVDAFGTWLSTGALRHDIGVTVLEAGIGFVGAMVLGALLAVVLASSRLLTEVAAPYVAVGNALPKIALAPLFLLLFGLGSDGKIYFVIASTAFTPFYAIFRALTTLDVTYANHARLLGAPRRRLAWDVYVPSIAGALVATVRITLAFSLLAAVVAEMVGIVSSLSALARSYIDSFVAFGNAIPKLVLIPFFIVWFGFGRVPGMIVTAISVVFLTAITIQAAMANIGARYVDHARLLGAGRLGLITSVFLPGIGVWIVASARLSVGIAFQAAVVSEFFGSTEGLGYLISQGEQTFNSSEIFAGVVITAALAYGVDALLGLVDARISRKTGLS